MRSLHGVLIRIGVGLVLVVTAAGCGGGGGSSEAEVAQDGSDDGECGLTAQKQWLFDVMTDTYLWYDEVPQVDLAAFDSLEALLDALRFEPLDRFSYLTTVEEYTSLFEEGTYVGYGFNLVTTGPDTLQLGFVFDDAPAGRAGLDRGDRVVAMNGVAIEQILAEDRVDEFLGPDEVGVELTMTVQPLMGDERVVDLVKDVVVMNTVLHSEVLETNGIKVGYLVLQSFLEPTNAELAAAFESFRDANVSELILDLRYNGGGRISVSRNLGNYSSGAQTGSSDVFARLVYNDKYQGRNSTFAFNSDFAAALDVARAVVITMPGTCSASELVINGLAPFMDVITIGQTTCGKPVGQVGTDRCGIRVQPIEFKTVNALDQGDYFDGLQPTCPASDDLSARFGDPAEEALGTALSYLTGGSCPLGIQSASVSAELPMSGWRREIGAY